MNGVLRWMIHRLGGISGPVFVTPPPPVRPPPSQHLDECECGRAHPVGWICAAAIGGRS
jgi:hypothetical protein